MQSVKSGPPIKVVPLPDESPTSWLMRISLKYHISLRDLVSIYGLEELMKQPLNITADLRPLSIFLPEGMELPNTVQNKIESFEWKKGRSEWLIHPNKKGSMMHNSYTRICPKCLKEKGYYQLKWQFRIMEYCVEHSIRLIEICPKCKTEISTMFKTIEYKRVRDLSNSFNCLYCGYDLRMSRSKKITPTFLEEQNMILKAYSDEPINYKYLMTKL